MELNRCIIFTMKLTYVNKIFSNIIGATTMVMTRVQFEGENKCVMIQQDILL